MGMLDSIPKERDVAEKLAALTKQEEAERAARAAPPKPHGALLARIQAAELGVPSYSEEFAKELSGAVNMPVHLEGEGKLAALVIKNLAMLEQLATECDAVAAEKMRVDDVPDEEEAPAAIEPPDAPPPAASPPPEAPAEPKKRGRGRPRKAAAPGQPTDVGAIVAEAAQAPAADGVGTSPGPSNTRAQTTPVSGIELWVDCLPMVGEPANTAALDVYKDEVLSKLAANGGQPIIHVLCAPKDSVLAYGGWEGVLIQYVRAYPPAPGRYAMLHVRGDKVREALVEALRPLCQAYHRGV